MASNTQLRLGLRLLLPLGLLGVWQALSLTWKADPRVATPAGVLRAFGELAAKGDLQVGALVSIRHILVSFLIAVVTGGGLGLLMGYLPLLDRWVGPLVHTLRPIAPYAWIPLAILWFGTGDMAVVSIVTYAAFFPMLVNAMAGARNLNRNLVNAAHALGAPTGTLFARVIFPAALPHLLVGARLAMGSAWTAVVAAELASGARGGQGATGGLGQMMFVFYSIYINLNYIVACTITVGVIGLLLDRVLHWLYRRLTPWSQSAG